MNDLKSVMESSLKEIQFTEKKKEIVLRKCREHNENQTKQVGKKQICFRRYAGVVAACLILCIGGTVVAKALLWDDYVAKQYRVDKDEQLQEETLKDGLTATRIASTEDNGIKIEVLQTVANNNHIDIYLKIQAENEDVAKKLQDVNPEFELSFENSKCGLVDGSMANYYTGEGLKTTVVSREADIGKNLEYEIYNINASVTGNSSLNGDTAHLKIHNFVGNSQTSPDKVVEGNWELSWEIQAEEDKKTITFDKDYTMYGKTFHLNKVELSSTGISVYISKKEIDEERLLDAMVYIVAKSEQLDEKPGWEYESLEWRGVNGIPLSLYKTLSDVEEVEIVEQMQEGIYKGEYIDVNEWNMQENHYVIDQWAFQVKMSDGTIFEPENSTGLTEDLVDDYKISESYVGYLDMNNVSEIWIGDCAIPLSEGIIVE